MKNRPEQPTLIAVMTCGDAPTLHTILAEAGGAMSVEDVKAIQRQGAAFFVAYIGDVPAGLIGYRWEDRKLRIFNVVVRDAYRRLGVARRLVQAVESVGAALGTRVISIEVAHEMIAMMRLERFGYEAGTPEGDRVLLSKVLVQQAS